MPLSLLRFVFDTPLQRVAASSGLRESCPKIGDIPKPPFSQLAALMPLAGTIKF